MRKAFFILLSGLFLPVLTYAQFSVSLHGYLKSLQTLSFSDPDSAWVSDNLLHNRLTLSMSYKENLTAGIDLRSRVYYGESVTNNPLYADLMDVDAGMVDASFLLADKKSYFVLSQVDRAWVSYQREKWVVTLGRQRINWGQTFVWNPNDLFNAYSFFDFDYEEKPGSDAFRLQYYTSASGRVEIAAKLDSADRLTAGALWMFNKKGFDIQLLGGVYNSDDVVAGLGFTGNVLNGALRGELSYFHPIEQFNDSKGTLLVSAGYDYMFKNSITLQTEALFIPDKKSSGSLNFADIYYMEPSAKNLSFSRWSLFTMASYPLNPLINASVSVMYYPERKLMFTSPGFTISISQNTDLMLSAYYFRNLDSDSSLDHYTMLFGRLRRSF